MSQSAAAAAAMMFEADQTHTMIACMVRQSSLLLSFFKKSIKTRPIVASLELKGKILMTFSFAKITD